jgi:hypothetical protein
VIPRGNAHCHNRQLPTVANAPYAVGIAETAIVVRPIGPGERLANPSGIVGRI